VIVGYNEFCAPGINEALQEAVDRSANKIIVATTMMTRGGEHAEKDIPLHISEFRKLYPDIEIIYAWPFDKDKVAHFLSEQISRFS
jgi:sirohydrochlorin cobaltochelatase